MPPAIAILSLIILSNFLPAQDSGWTGWRGANRDGIVAWLPENLPSGKLLWKLAVAGECHAGAAATGEWVVIADHGKGKDFWRGIEIKSGKQVWEYAYDNKFEMDFGAAPRTTPLIYKNRVYGLNALGLLLCLDLKTGDLQWSVDLKNKYVEKDGPTWGYCSSPLAADGKIICASGSEKLALVAFNPDSGKMIWEAPGVGTNYSSFISIQVGGTSQIVGYESESISGWSAADGKKLWSMKVDRGDGYIVPTPVFAGGKLLLTTTAEETRLYNFDKAGKLTTRPTATSMDLWPDMSTPVVMGNLVLGSSEGLVALDLNDGLKTVWKFEQDDSIHGFNQFVASKDRLLVETEDGHMVLVAIAGAKSKVLGKLKLTGDSMVHPTVHGDRLIVRDKEFVYCYSLK